MNKYTPAIVINTVNLLRLFKLALRNMGHTGLINLIRNELPLLRLLRTKNYSVEMLH